MGFFGGNASASQTLTNAITYSPIMNIGDDNESDLTNTLENRASSEALAKDEMTASVGVGVAGGSGSGGAVQANDITPSKSSVFDTVAQVAKDNTLLYTVGVGVVVAGGAIYFIKKKK